MLLEKQGHLKTNRLCGLEVYHQLELGWLFDRQIGGLCPFKDFVNVGRCSAIDVRETRPIEDQPACVDKLTAAVDRRQPTPCSQLSGFRPRCKCTNNDLLGNHEARPFGCVRLVYEFTFP